MSEGVRSDSKSDYTQSQRAGSFGPMREDAGQLSGSPGEDSRGVSAIRAVARGAWQRR